MTGRAYAFCLSLLFGAAVAAQTPPAPVPTTGGATALQRDVLAALSGESEIRPGVKLVNRATPDNKKEARTYLAGVLKRLGLEPQTQAYAENGENVYARLASGQPSAETIVVGAHFDTTARGPGANDDGSGVAAVIGVAEELVKVAPRSRDILFVFFDEEERGLLGSRAFAQMLKDDNKAIHSVHTIDQVAWDQNGNRALELELPYPGALELYEKIAAGFTPAIPLFTTTETGSDHSSFRRLGFNAIGITEEYRHGDTTPFIHRATDTFETINFEYLATSTRLVTEVIKALVK